MDLLVQDNLHSYGDLILPAELNDPPSARDVVNASRLAQAALQSKRKYYTHYDGPGPLYNAL